MAAPGYFVVTLDIHDAEKFQAYRDVVGPTVAKYGGEVIARGSRLECVEGEAPKSVNVILRFPSYDQAKAWYTSQDYAGPLALRLAASTGNGYLIEGVE